MLRDIDRQIREETKANLDLGLEIRYVQWDCNLSPEQKEHKLRIMTMEYQRREAKIVRLVEYKYEKYPVPCCTDTSTSALADLLP